MGGRGSGRFGPRGGRATTTDAMRLTVGGLLSAPPPMRNIGVLYLPDERVRISFFGQRLFDVHFATTPHRHGGGRRWFLCSDCGNRRAVLYLYAGKLICRQCHGLIYASQLESYGSRKLRKGLHLEWRLAQFSEIVLGAQSGADSGKVISAKK